RAHVLQPWGCEGMHAGSEQRLHLLRRHGIPGTEPIDASHARPNPRPRALPPVGVVGRQSNMALLGGIQRRDLPRQVVIPRPGAELVDAHRHNPPKANPVTLAVSAEGVRTGDAGGVSAMTIWRG